MIKFLLVIYFILNFSLAHAGITGTPAPKDHKASSNNASDDQHDHSDEDDKHDHDHKDN